jgi:hypothetical protein
MVLRMNGDCFPKIFNNLLFVMEKQSTNTECLNIVMTNFIHRIVNIYNRLSISHRCVKVKNLNLTLSLIKHRDMKTYRSGDTALSLLTSAVDGSEWSASRFCRFKPGMIA